MHISCEKCSTTYMLDERVLPPAGAPVQCTRCGHVFTARPPSAAAKPPEPKPIPPNAKTQVFGAALSAAPTAPVSQEALAHGPATPERGGTQQFGRPPADAPVSSTQIFGAAPAAPPPRATTQMFGAAPAAPAPPAPSVHSTQMFGAPPAAAEPPRATTQMFGAAPAAPARSSTQMFGAAPAAPPARSSTQMFGAAPAAPAPEPARSSTQMFGAAPAPEPARSSTQMFGAAPAAPVAPPGRSSTQMFGAAPAAPEPTPPGRSSTQMFGASPAAPASGPTAVFRAAPGPIPDPELDGAGSGSSGTQLFGEVPEELRQPQPDKPIAPIPTKTAIFGGPTEGGQEEDSDAGEGPLGPSSSGRGVTRTFALSPQAAAARTILEPPPPQRAPTAAAARKAVVELPPEKPDLEDDRTLPDDPALSFEMKLKRRNRTALTVVALVLLGAGTFFGVRFFLGRRLEVPAAWTALRDQANSLLRRDDPTSRRNATARLAELVRDHPQYVEARADYLLALSLQLDDSRLARNRIQVAAAELNKRIKKLQDAQSPGDWVNRVNAMRDELIALDKKNEPLLKEGEALDAELNAAFKALQEQPRNLGPAERVAVARAEAVYYGVRGRDEALGRSQAYESQGGTDGWAQIAYAEFALNSKSPPDTLAQAREQMDALREKDKTFLRPYVLAARLAFAQKKYDEASNTLEAVVAMNRSHTVASELLEWVQEAQRAAR